MLRYAISLVVVSIVGMAAFCGGGSASPTPVSDEEFRAAAEAAVTASLLTLNDLPAAWVGTPPEPDEDDPAGDAAFRDALSPACQGYADLFDDSGGDYPGAAFEMESDTFEPENTDGPADDISSDAAAFRAVEDLNAEWDEVVNFVRDCGDEMPEAMRRAFATDPDFDGVELTKLEFRQADAPAIGDRAARWEMEMAFSTQGFEFDATVVSTGIQSGRMIGSVTWTDFGSFDTTLGESLTALVAERLQKANEVLPE